MRLSELQKAGRSPGLPLSIDLADAAGRGGDVVIVHRLYRVNDQNIRFQILHALCNGVDIRFCKDEKIVTRYAEPLRAHFELALAFLTAGSPALPVVLAPAFSFWRILHRSLSPSPA